MPDRGWTYDLAFRVSTIARHCFNYKTCSVRLKKKTTQNNNNNNKTKMAVYLTWGLAKVLEELFVERKERDIGK